MFLKRWFNNKMNSVERTSDEDKKWRKKLVKNALQGKLGFKTKLTTPRWWSEDDMNEELLAVGTHLERIKIVKCYFSPEEFHKVLQNTVLKKDDSFAKTFMKKYEEFYSSSDYKMALRSLNLATLFATSKNIGAIYKIRSALLYELGEWEDCLQDTELGLQMNCPMPLTIKLKCENLAAREKFRKSTNLQVIAKHEFRENAMLQLYKGNNDKISSASSVVEIRWEEKLGRGLFVTEDIEPGTVLLIEDPYATTLNEGLNWDIRHCWRCLKTILRTITCEGCVFAVYCSTQCRSEDENLGHAYECPCLPYFQGIFVGTNVHLSYKTILVAGPEELFKLYKTSTLEEIQKTRGIDPKTDIYDCAAYLAPLTSASHIENDGKFPELVWMAILFIECLDVKTNFFAQVDESEKEEFKDFVASLALFHDLSVQFNCMGLDEDADGYEFIGRSNVTQEDTCFATGNYPLTSLMNHSCDPNMNRTTLTNGKMVVMAMRRLKAGEEMLFNYGFDYATTEFNDRQESLLTSYLFSCNCVACKYDWPLHEVLKQRPENVRLRCPDCTDKFGYEEYPECALSENDKVESGTCPSCLKEFPLLPLYLELDRRDSDLQLSKDYLSAKNPLPAIPLLLDYIKFLQKRVCQPCGEFCSAQRSLASAYSMVMEN